jgi:hypothetical protein
MRVYPGTGAFVAISTVCLAFVVSGCSLNEGRPASREPQPSQPSVAQQKQLPRECDPDALVLWIDRPQADWAAQVATRAGFRIVGEADAALFAARGTHGFAIWATHIVKSTRWMAQAESWPVFGRIGGVAVWGDGDLWAWWSAHGYIVWLNAGHPSADATLPSLTAIRRMVRVSRDLPPPCRRPLPPALASSFRVFT